MSNFIIDAPLLACPDPALHNQNDFQEIFECFLSRLADLSKLRTDFKSILFWRDMDLSFVLNEQNCFPFRYRLSNAFQKLYDPADFQLEDINILATTLLERSLIIEDAGNIKDILVSACTIAQDPVRNRAAPFVDHLCRVVAIALPVLGDGKTFSKNTFIASSGSSSGLAHFNVTYTIDLIDYGGGSLLECCDKNTVDILNYRGCVHLFDDVDLPHWWSTKSVQAIVDVCSIAATNGQENPVELIKKLRDILSIGSDFIQSADKLGFMHEHNKIKRLIEVCADIMLNRNLAHSHWLRTGKGANSPQKKTGDWEAWRHDIDQEFHLHYWRFGSRIKLENVVVHNDFNITN